jgi:hypothetical protein
LLKGASGGPKYGATSHFWPWGHSGAQLSGGKELFPTPKYKRGVLVSSAGVGAVLGGLALWARKVGVAKVGLLYGAPLVVVNAWLVLYTWLQHTGQSLQGGGGGGANGQLFLLVTAFFIVFSVLTDIVTSVFRIFFGGPGF